jgi:hypothetical protein
MKKWLLLYIFFVSIACFPSTVLANLGKNFQVKNHNSASSVSKEINFQKTALTAADHHDDTSTDAIFHYSHGLNILCAATSCYTAELIFCSSVSKYHLMFLSSGKEVERVLKDYLLHLFPSHYFW